MVSRLLVLDEIELSRGLMEGPFTPPANGQYEHLARPDIPRPPVLIVQRNPAMNDMADFRVRLTVGGKPPRTALPHTDLRQPIRRRPERLRGFNLIAFD